jgi:hypothetical protein
VSIHSHVDFRVFLSGSPPHPPSFPSFYFHPPRRNSPSIVQVTELHRTVTNTFTPEGQKETQYNYYSLPPQQSLSEFRFCSVPFPSLSSAFLFLPFARKEVGRFSLIRCSRIAIEIHRLHCSHHSNTITIVFITAQERRL